MNVFVLCTGRCGSTTFVEACKHITNYTSAHESRAVVAGPGRVQYPADHIEADNRLSWFLGRLEKAYGDDAFYVHLTRDRMQTAKSFTKRFGAGLIMNAYARGILLGPPPAEVDPLDLCLDYVDTVTSNIDAFLKTKTRKMDFRLETAKDDFRILFERIGAQGDLAAALAEWDSSYNVTVPVRKAPLIVRLSRKTKHLARKASRFVKDE